MGGWETYVSVLHSTDAAVNFLAVCKDDSTEQVNRKVTDGKGPWTS